MAQLRPSNAKPSVELGVCHAYSAANINGPGPEAQGKIGEGLLFLSGKEYIIEIWEFKGVRQGRTKLTEL